jgi:predicted transcriptional regulator of viral defense system
MKKLPEQQQRNQKTSEFLSLKRVFTLDEFARYLSAPRRLAQFRIRYFQGQGRVKRVANGVYATVPVGADTDRFEPDAYLVAAAVRPDAVFAYHSALELHGQGHSVWWTCTVCTERPRLPVKLGRTTIKFLRHPPAVQATKRRAKSATDRRPDRWTTVVLRGDRRLTVTTPERTLVDGFRELGLVGGADELVESMDGFVALKVDELQEVLEAYENKRLWAAVGWYLERRVEDLYVDSSTLERFRARRPSSRVYLVPGQRGGVLERGWNLIVPEHLAIPTRARRERRPL